MLYLQRHVRTQTLKGKTKERGTIRRQGNPWSVQQGYQREENRRNEEDVTVAPAQTRRTMTIPLPLLERPAAGSDCNCRLLRVRLQSQTTEDTSRLLLLGLLSIGVLLVSRLCCGFLLSVEGVLAVCAIIGRQSSAACQLMDSLLLAHKLAYWVLSSPSLSGVAF